MRMDGETEQGDIIWEVVMTWNKDAQRRQHYGVGENHSIKFARSKGLFTSQTAEITRGTRYLCSLGLFDDKSSEPSSQKAVKARLLHSRRERGLPEPCNTSCISSF